MTKKFYANVCSVSARDDHRGFSWNCSMRVVNYYSRSMTTTEKPIPTPDQMLLERVQWVVGSIDALLAERDPRDTQDTITTLASMVADDLEAIAGTVRRRWVQ